MIIEIANLEIRPLDFEGQLIVHENASGDSIWMCVGANNLDFRSGGFGLNEEQIAK